MNIINTSLLMLRLNLTNPIMSSSDYEKVGYLPTELTRFVHPQPKDPKLEVTVRQIRFCTTFLINGFYLTIEISTTDLWEKPCSD